MPSSLEARPRADHTSIGHRSRRGRRSHKTDAGLWEARPRADRTSIQHRSRRGRRSHKTDAGLWEARPRADQTSIRHRSRRGRRSHKHQTAPRPTTLRPLRLDFFRAYNQI
jgi:hypothetical protein